MDRELISLKALKRGKYGTRRLVAGDVFEAKPKDAKLLRALGKAEIVVKDSVAADSGPVPVVPRPLPAKGGKNAAKVAETAPAPAPVLPDLATNPEPVVEVPADGDEA